MTAVVSHTVESKSDSVEKPLQPRERTPWLLAFLCLLIPILPSYSVIPGPLKGLGSPARLITMAFLVLIVIGFVFIRRTAATQTIRPGVVIIVGYFLMKLVIYGVGVSHLGSKLAELSKGHAFLALLTEIGVALYAMTRVETTRQRSIVLGCLAIGLTFNCVVGLLQASAHIDLHQFFQPPGFVSNIPDEPSAVAPTLAQRYGATRVFGTSNHPIEYSVLAAVTVPLTIHFARYASKRQLRPFAVIAAALALLAVPTGISRGGVVAFLAAFLVYMWTFPLRQFVVGIVVGTGVLLAQFVAAPGSAQALWKSIVNSAEDDSVASRLAAYSKVSQTFIAPAGSTKVSFWYNLNCPDDVQYD